MPNHELHGRTGVGVNGLLARLSPVPREFHRSRNQRLLVSMLLMGVPELRPSDVAEPLFPVIRIWHHCLIDALEARPSDVAEPLFPGIRI